MEIQLFTKMIVSLNQQKNTSKVTPILQQKRSVSVSQPIKSTENEDILTGFIIW